MLLTKKLIEVKINSTGPAEVEIAGELSGEVFATFRSPALKQLNQAVKLDGFRPGHVPDHVLIEKLGEEKVLLEMAELALREYYPKIIAEHNLDAIGRPEITLTKIATGNPLGFKIKTALAPTVKLPDYKRLAAGVAAGPNRRAQIMEAILKASELIIPKLLVESPEAEPGVQITLALGEIAHAEKIGVTAEELAAEVKHLKEHYPKEPEERLRQYVAGLIINEKVWRFLEEQK